MTKDAGMNVADMNFQELERARQALALDAEENKPGAVEALEQIEARMVEVRRGQDLQNLAGRERAVREYVRRREQEEAQQRQRQARHAELERQLRALAPGIDDAAEALVAKVREFMALAKEQHLVMASAPSTQRVLRRYGAAVANSIVWRLATVPALAERLGRPDRWYWRPVAEILNKSTSAAASVEP